jgi:hypothetical protein
MGAEADQPGLVAPLFLAQLTDVELVALLAHLGMRGIADMAVVSPDHRLGVRPLGIQQLAERLEHVRVAQDSSFPPRHDT